MHRSRALWFTLGLVTFAAWMLVGRFGGENHGTAASTPKSRGRETVASYVVQPSKPVSQASGTPAASSPTGASVISNAPNVQVSTPPPAPANTAANMASSNFSTLPPEAMKAALLSQKRDLSDPRQREELVRQLKAIEDAELASAYAKARQLGLPIEGDKPGGGRFALVGFDGDRPLYHETGNVNAAISTAANLVRSTAPYNVDGNGWKMGLWEAGGIPRVTHQEFGSPTKVTVRDGYTIVSDHATHVGGTLAALGVNPSLKGMAPGLLIDAYSSGSEISEMTSAGAAYGGEPGKIYVSNHSYGYDIGWDDGVWDGLFSDNGNAADDIESYFGRYNSSSVTLDAMLVNLPYYLPFYSAGNQRNDGPPATGAAWTHSVTGLSYTYDPAQHPAGDGVYKLGYDNLDYTKTCKNIMSIGAVNDAVSGGVRSTAAGTITSFSSTGPTDDGRIKPDVVANGASLLSASYTSDTATVSMSGTSMSSPNAAGSAMLLVDYYGDRFPGQFMRASTLKALIIHTADDIGNPGPDYFYGWGLMNTKAAADHIKRQADNAGYNGMIEASLTTAEPSDTYSFTWNGSDPIRVTLCWTDPAGTPVNAHDDRAKDLINDLNLSVAGPAGSTHLPFVMPYVGDWTNAKLSANATTGVNTVDNVEQVLVTTPPATGLYTVTVNHAGSLTGGAQNYSLIISGQSTDSLGVSPGDSFLATGPAGGPFTPASKEYTLSNLGGNSLNWTATANQTWLSLSTASGTLNVGESIAVTASITSAANSLPGGNHNATLTFTNTTSGSISTRGAVLSAGRNFLSFNLDTNPGWTTTGQWAFGTPGGTGGDPAAAKTGTNVYGYNLAGAYTDSMPAYSLTTTALNCTGKENISLGFWRWLGMESSSFDQASVQVSKDGTSWTTVWSHSGSSFTDTSWTYFEYDISAVADDQPTVFVRWVIGPTDGSVTYAGWNLDDIVLLGDTIPPRPEIVVHDGASTTAPQITDEQAEVVDFGFTAAGTPVTRSFTIANTGTLGLTVSSITAPAGFTVLGAPASVAAGASSTFQVRFDANLPGVIESSVIITSNDADESSFDFPVKAAVDQPEIALDLNGSPITDGQSQIVDYLATTQGSGVTRSFTIANLGVNVLSISSITAPSGYTVLGAPASVAAGNAATFQIRLNAATAGIFNGSVVIASDDPDEASFDFPVRGTVITGAVQPGAVDTTFAGTGRATAGLGVSSLYAYALAVQPDGKTVAAGRAYNGSNNDFIVVRFNTDGSLDSSFGAGGHVITPVGTGTDEAHKILVLPDGKLLVGGEGSGDFALVRYNSDGTLDTTFDGDGILVTPVLASTDYIRDMMFQPDGKLLAIGAAYNGTNYDFAAVRFNTDYTLDTSFDTDGKATVAVATGSEYAEGVALQADGKIILAGYGNNGTNDDFAMARLTSAGALDTTFTATGKFLTAIGTSTDQGRAVVIQPDGKIVVAGSAFNLGMTLVRYNSDGTLDTSFDTDGKVTTIVSTSNFGGATSLALLPDGKLLAGGNGYATSTNGIDFAIVCYQANGALDTTYGPSGNGMSLIPATSSNNNSDWSEAMVVHADGSATLAGYSYTIYQRYDLVVARLNAGGVADTSFAEDGTVVFNPLASSADFGFGLALKPDGTVTLAGYSYTGVSDDFSAAQWLADGTASTAFGTVGNAWLTGSVLTERSYAAASQPDGKIILGGYITNTNNDFQLLRLNTNGTLDTSFDTDGRVSTTIGSGSEIARALIVQPDGKIIAAGYSSNGTNDDFALVRYNTNGSLDTTFDTDGKVTSAIDTSTDQAFSALRQADGKIVVAGSAVVSGTDFAVARYNSNGSLDTTFDTDGKATFTMGTSTDVAYGITQQRNGKLILGGDASNDFGLLRLNANGSLDSTFGVNGRAITAVGTATDTCYAIAVQPDDKIIAVGRTYNGTNYDIAVLRYTADGRRDTSFGTGGKIIAAPGTGDDYANAVALQSDGSIVVGGYTYQGTNPEFLVMRFVGDSLQPELALFDGDTSLAPVLTDGQPTAVDFGSTGTGSAITHDFTISNPGTSDLVLTSITAPAGFSVQNAPSLVSAGGEATFQIQLTAASAGFFSGNVILSSNDADEASFEFPVRGGVDVPEIALSADGQSVADGQALPVSFRSTPQGSPVTRSFVIENTGLAALSITSITPPAGFTVQNAPTSIPASSSAVFQVTLTAATSGSFAGNVVIASNDADEASFEAPVASVVTATALASGQPDPSFRGDGFAPTGFGGANDEAYATLALSDGKTLIGGSAYMGGDYEFFLARLNVDGTLDRTFGNAGIVTTRVGTSSDRIYSLARQPDGKILAGGYTYNGSNYDFALVRYLADGSLDSSFDTDGIVTTSIGASDDYGWKALVQGDGKIILAGQAFNGSNIDFALARYTSAGTLDTTFGTGGKVITPIGTGTEIAYTAALQGDGKIILAGYTAMTNDDFALVRYNTDGTLDTTFDTDGKVTTTIGTGTDRIHDMLIQPDGKILVGGYMVGSDFALARYNANGSLDTTFDTDGKVTTPIGTGTDRIYGIALQSDDKIVAAGYSITTGTADDFAIARYTSTGALDTSFDTDGKRVLPLAAGNNIDVARAVALHADGSIVLAGYASNGNDTDVAVTRLEADGSTRSTFGSSGVALLNLGQGADYGFAMAIQPDQKIIAAGYIYQGNNDDVTAARFLPDGTLDTSYGTAGKTLTRVGISAERAYGVAVQPDGKIVFGGYASISSSDDFMVMRQNADGTPDTSFGNNGSATTTIGTGTEQGRALLLQGDGRIVLAGYSSNGSNDDYALARYNADGSLDGTFGTGGKVTTTATVGTDRLYAIAAYSGGRILVAGETRNAGNTSTDFGLARYNANGTLDTSFGTGGLVTLTPASNSEYVYALQVLPDGKILAAGEANVDAAIVRLNPNGSYDPSFGSGGKAIVPVLASTDTIYGIALQPDGKIVATGRTWNGSNYDIAVLRFLENGLLDSSFDGDGKLVIPYGPGTDYGYAIAVQNDGAIVITGYTVNPGSDTQMLVLRLLPDSLVPEITVADQITLPATPLTDGQAAVLDFGAVPTGSPVTRGFLFTNPGSADLVINSITAPAGFSVLGVPFIVTAGGIATFQIRLDASSTGFFSGSVVITSNDADEATFDFPVRGSVDAPEIAVSLDGATLADAQNSPVNLRSTLTGSPVIRSFTISNAGFSSLTISSITAPAGFTVLNAPTSIASSSSAVFQLRLDAASAGLFSGNLVIASNDSDEASFEIPVTGSVQAVLPPPGQLDTGFGSGGQVTHGIATAQDHYYSVAQQADGKIIAAGRTYTGGRISYDVLVTRWNTDGTPDITFGSGGAVIYDVNGNSDTANSVLEQPDGKIIVAGIANNGTNDDMFAVRLQTNGALDNSFSGDGKVIVAPTTSFDSCNTASIQADGKIIIAGHGLFQSGSLFNYDMVAVRFTSSGELDMTFDSDGILSVSVSSTTDFCYSSTVQTDGKIILAGMSNNGSNDDFSLVRLNVNGSLDTTFDTDGKVTTTIGTSTDTIRQIQLQNDGKIVAAGYANMPSVGDDFALARYNSDGSLDTSFDTDGKVTTTFGTSTDWAYGLDIQSDGKILTTGITRNGTNYDIALARHTTTGALDTTLDSDGKATFPIGTGSDYGRAIKALADGRIAIAGFAAASRDDDAVLLVITAAGALDTTFGGSGILSNDFAVSFDAGYAMAMLPDDRIFITGNSNSGSSSDFHLTRFLSDGTADTSVPPDGITRVPVGTNTDIPYAIAVQPDGKTVLAGYSLATNNDISVIRLNTDGTLDSTFGSGGKFFLGIGSGEDIARAIALQPDGKILVGGYTNNGSNDDIALVRLNANGTLDATFGTTGIVTMAFGVDTDRCWSMTLQPDGKILLGCQTSTGTLDDFALARYNSNGTLDTTFGTGGKVVSSLSTLDDIAYTIQLLPDGKILLGGWASNGSDGELTIARYLANGSLDTTFGTSGKTMVQTSASYLEVIYDLALQPDGRILATGYRSNSTDNDIVTIRLLANGMLDTTFGTSGVSIVNPAPGRDQYAYGIATQSDGSIIVGGWGYIGNDGQVILLRYTPDTLAPEIVVHDGATTAAPQLADGQSTAIDFGITTTSTPVTRSFTVQNTGTADLLLSSITPPAGYTLQTALPASTLAPSDSYSIQTRLDAAGAGTFSGTLSLGSNDADESSFDLPLIGLVVESAPYQTWATGAGLSAVNGAPNANPLGDGISNLLKYAFDLNPTAVDLHILTPATGTSGLPTVERTGSGASTVFRIEFIRRISGGITYLPQKSNDLNIWSPITTTPTVTPISPGWERVLIEEPADPALVNKIFSRVRVTQP
ncbi:MAG: choice-of-anchor D domain-containing protein [Verrucomicrobiaceae bacterium]|nr:choice-of-anchor D domain-containing protein [Verrucomicrobiaceae bacterium]